MSTQSPEAQGGGGGDDGNGSPDGTGPDGQRPIKRLRFAPRTNLACTACRRRKTRCSGDFPTCGACSARHEECVFEGIRAQVTVRASESSNVAGENEVLAERRAERGVEKVVVRDEGVSLPSPDLRRKAIAYYREHYEPTLLCFVPPQTLILDDTGQNLPVVLMLSILALASKFVPEFTPPGGDSSKVSNGFADATRRELDRDYNKPDLATVQACIILCIHEVGYGLEDQGWFRLGHAIRMAQVMLLHKLDSDSSPSEIGTASQPSESLVTLESKRRTLWCAFVIERLLANGRDRITILQMEQITTRLPQLDEDFIYGRENSNRTLKDDLIGNPKNREGLHSHLIRLLKISGDVMVWHGHGGRYADSTCPWLPEMSFSVLDRALQQWRAALPNYLDHTPSNLPLILAAGHGKIWIPMFCLFYQAQAILHREYIPFTSIEGYDPSHGPCDGPSLTPSNRTQPPPGWWHNSAKTMIESANAITSLHQTIEAKHISGSTSYPFPGLPILTAASIHVQCLVYSWPSMQYLTVHSREFLKRDLEACAGLGREWGVARGWIQQLSLYYKLNILTSRSFEDDNISIHNLNISHVKEGILKFIQQRPPPPVSNNLGDGQFDFEWWIRVLESSGVEEGGNGGKEATGNGTVGGRGGGWWDDWGGKGLSVLR